MANVIDCSPRSAVAGVTAREAGSDIQCTVRDRRPEISAGQSACGFEHCEQVNVDCAK